MATVESLGPGDLSAVMRMFRDALQSHRAEINQLNVYPVPDGDTGTNMALTLVAVAEELEVAGETMDEVCAAMSHGSLMGARGNSGVILSQLLRGLAGTFRTVGRVDAQALAAGLSSASEAAYEAVMRPVEGTILTVVRDSASAARDALQGGEDRSPSLAGVIAASLDAAEASLIRTPELLEVLRHAGVVDAGGAGFVLLLDAFSAVVTGRPIPDPSTRRYLDGVRRASAAENLAGHRHSTGDNGAGDHRSGEAAGVDDLRYEVMYLLEAPDDSVGGFREAWSSIGDSIVVVGGDGIWNCHIHTNDIGAAVEAALDVGRPRRIRVTDLVEQMDELGEERWVLEADTGAERPEDTDDSKPVNTAVVAVCVGDGVARIFRSLKVQQIVTGGQTMNPSTAMLLDAVERAPSNSVVILPNNKNIIPVAEQVISQTDKSVVVIATLGVVEGFAALIQYDPSSPIQDNAKAMSEAADSIIAAEVTQAVRPGICEMGPISEGDWMGITGEGIRAVESELGEACTSLLAGLVNPGNEIVTIIEGDGATPAVTRRITEWLDQHHPDVGAEIHQGGQPLYPYLFGIE